MRPAKACPAQLIEPDAEPGRGKRNKDDKPCDAKPSLWLDDRCLPVEAHEEGEKRQYCQAEKNGGKPFMDYQLPHAALSLKQGAGRLIRTETDRGVLMICDTRLADKPYGKLLLNALPAMTRTRKLEVVMRFFAAETQGKAAAATMDPQR